MAPRHSDPIDYLRQAGRARHQCLILGRLACLQLCYPKVHFVRGFVSFERSPHAGIPIRAIQTQNTRSTAQTRKATCFKHLKKYEEQDPSSPHLVNSNKSHRVVVQDTWPFQVPTWMMVSCSAERCQQLVTTPSTVSVTTRGPSTIPEAPNTAMPPRMDKNAMTVCARRRFPTSTG